MERTYCVQMLLLGVHEGVDISEADFLKVKNFYSALSIMRLMELKFSIFCSNVLDFEKEIAAIAISDLMNTSFAHSDFWDLYIPVNKHMLNILSSARTYNDQREKRLRELDTEIPSLSISVSKKANEVYDNNFSYRFMEALRNVAQHQELPIGNLGFQHTRMEKTKLRRATFDPMVKTDNLQNSTLKSSIKQEIHNLRIERLAVKRLIREYVEGISAIHYTYRAQTETLAHEVVAFASDLRQRFASLYLLESDVALHAIAKESGSVVGKVPLLHAIYDDMLRQRKGHEFLNSLSTAYVSLEIVEQ